MGTRLEGLHAVRAADTVDLDLSSRLYDRLIVFAALADRLPGDVADAILCDAMEPPVPARTRVTLSCTRCGFSAHRWVRATLAGAGTWAHVFGCVKCYRLRRFGIESIPGCGADDPDDEPVRVRAPTAPWAVQMLPLMMVPGVPEALQ